MMQNLILNLWRLFTKWAYGTTKCNKAKSCKWHKILFRKKQKRKPENARVKVIVETAIKDGIIDVIRDYRYKFIKNLKVLVSSVNKNIMI